MKLTHWTFSGYFLMQEQSLKHITLPHLSLWQCQLIYHSSSTFTSSPTGKLKFKMSQGSKHEFAKNAHMKGYKNPFCFGYSSHSLWVFDVVYAAKLYKPTGPKCCSKAVIKQVSFTFPLTHIHTSHTRKYLWKDFLVPFLLNLMSVDSE